MRYLIATHLTGQNAARLFAKVVFHGNYFHRNGLCLGDVSCALIEKPSKKVFRPAHTQVFLGMLVFRRRS